MRGLSTNQTKTRKGSVLGSSGERELKGRTGQPKTLYDPKRSCRMNESKQQLRRDYKASAKDSQV